MNQAVNTQTVAVDADITENGMGGRSRALVSAQLIGVRVAGQLTYVPAHKSGGYENNQKVTIPVYANGTRGTKRDGTPGRSDRFSLVVWGSLADICCRYLNKGRAIDVLCQPGSYQGKDFDPITQKPRMNPDGTFQMREKIAFTVKEINLAEQSSKYDAIIEAEIREGRRPPCWNIKGHPDVASWNTIKAARKVSVWDGVSDTYENAKVVLPMGNGITLMDGRLTASMTLQKKQASVPQQVGANGAPLTNQIAAVANGLPAGAKFDPHTGQPIAQQPKFDPNTGQPLTQVVEQPQFDPQTGVPLNNAAVQAIAGNAGTNAQAGAETPPNVTVPSQGVIPPANNQVAPTAPTGHPIY